MNTPASLAYELLNLFSYRLVKKWNELWLSWVLLKSMEGQKLAHFMLKMVYAFNVSWDYIPLKNYCGRISAKLVFISWLSYALSFYALLEIS